MAVYRVVKTNNYTTMCNHHLRNKNLTLKAKGLMSVVLSLPNDWDYSIDGLASICSEGCTAVKSALKELKLHGYLEVEKFTPKFSHTGRFEYVYTFYENPDNSRDKKQGIENLPIETLSVGNQRQLNKDKLIKERLSKEEQKIYSPETKDENSSQQTMSDSFCSQSEPCSCSGSIQNSVNDKSEQLEKNIDEVIQYLNEKAKSNFRANTKPTRSCIGARLKDGYTVEDFKKVIDSKVSAWLGTSMQEYLRPKTLFAPSNFESYLNAAGLPSNGTTQNSQGNKAPNFPSMTSISEKFRKEREKRQEAIEKGEYTPMPWE